MYLLQKMIKVKEEEIYQGMNKHHPDGLDPKITTDRISVYS